MEPEERDIKQELRELLDSYAVDIMDPPFKDWYQRVMEQEESGGWGAFAIRKDSRPKEKKKEVGFKVGDLVKRRSFVSEGSIGIVTRVDKVTSQYSIGSEPSQPTKKYLVTFQHDGSQTWLNEDQLDKME